VRSRDGQAYGPYVDFHVGFVILSVGRNPVYSGEYDLVNSPSRGGMA
jgi:hypothetical protein